MKKLTITKIFANNYFRKRFDHYRDFGIQEMSFMNFNIEKASLLQLGYLLLIFSATFTLFSCSGNSRYIRHIQQIEEGVRNPVSAEELEEAISKYRNRVEDIISAESKTANWYKILGIRYLDMQMYGKALENFQAAVEYYPTNQNLYYYIGLCSGYMAKASLDSSSANPVRERYLDLAESAYLRAIELEPRFARALYGLSVIYVFEKNEPEKALPHIELFTQIETADMDGKMILGRVYYSIGEFEKAVEVYDGIIQQTRDAARRAAAESNKAFTLEAMYSNGAS